MSKRPKVLIEKMKKLWYVRVIAANGKVLMISEGLSSLRRARENYRASVEAFGEGTYKIIDSTGLLK